MIKTQAILPLLALTCACGIPRAIDPVHALLGNLYWVRQSCSFYNTQDETMAKTLTIDVSSRGETVTVTIDVTVEKGRVEWRVVRAGVQVAEGQVAVGRAAHKVCWPAQPGIWQLEWSTEGFSGDRSFKIAATGR